MKKRYLPLSFLFLIILLLMPFLKVNAQVKNDYSKLIKKSILTPHKNSNKIDKILQKINPKNPDYPALKAIKGLILESTGNPDEIIHDIEELQKKVRYLTIEKELDDKDSKIEKIGTYANFSLWRELSYLLLGRSYYKKRYYNEALSNFSGIPESSPFYQMAYYGKIWTKFALNKKMTADEIKIFTQSPLEGEIQKSFFFYTQNQFLNASNIAKNIINQYKSIPHHLETTVFKLFAESRYKYWLELKHSPTFKENVEFLQDIIHVANRISSKNLSPEVLFFKSEAYWNLATIYRIEDPLKYEKRSNELFQKAYIPLKSLMNQTLTKKKPYLREEAFFLGVVILLELGEYKKAIPYLTIHKNIYPSGQYREDIHQLLGDYYFDKKKFKKANEEYRYLVEVASPEKATYGSYKAAWSFYNLGKKWAALRQMEKIILHLNKEKRTKKTIIRKSNIQKESTRDMLLFMAELMDAPKALKEMKIFSYDRKDKINGQEKLAMTYKKIGKFDDSNIIFEKLLLNYSKSSKYLEKSTFWLTEVLDNDLRNAKRELIPHHMRTYYPIISQHFSKDSPPKKVKTLINNFADLILIMHREAKKSETEEIWKALDQSYFVFNQFFSHEKIGKIWYHGAQRFEMLKKRIKSKHWYQKAALIDEFNYRKDAAYSYLSLVKDDSDEISLKRVKTPKKHEIIALEAKWYIDNFKEDRERNFADELYLEHLLFAQKSHLVKEYFSKIIKNEGLTFENKRKIKKVQSIISNQKRWDLLSEITDEIVQNTDNPQMDIKFYNDLKKLIQESAFQMAFITKDQETSRYWYKKSIHLNNSPEVTLKAYHNLALTYKKEEISKLTSLINELPEKEMIKNKIKDHLSLISGIWAHLANLYKENSLLTNYADALYHILELQNKTSDSYNILMIYGAFHEEEKFNKLYHEFLNHNPHFYKDQIKALNVARIYFELEDFESSFELIKKIVSEHQDDLSSSSYILLRDIFHRYPKKEEILTFFNAYKELFLNQIILTQTFDSFLHPNFDLSNLQKIDFSDELEGEGQNKSEKLLHYVKTTSSNIDLFNRKVEELKPFFKTKGQFTKEKSICLVPKLREKLISSLNSFLNHKIQHKNWVDFEQRIQSEIKKIENLRQKEQKSCQTIHKNNQIFKKGCLISSCYNFNSPNSPSSKNFFEMAKHGETFYLHLKSYESKNHIERLYIQGLIRLHYEDNFNARVFFSECLKENQKNKEEKDKNSIASQCRSLLKKVEKT